MAFPSSPINGQISVVNNISYVYNATLGAWFRNTLTSANVITTDTANVLSTVSSTSTTTGALIVAGGAGIGGNLYVGGNLVVTGNTTIQNYEIITNTEIANAIVASGNITTTGRFVTSNGVFWANGSAYSSGSASTSTSSLTPPTSPSVGDIWYHTGTDDIYRYTSDGTTTAWLDITGPTVANTTSGTSSNSSASAIFSFPNTLSANVTILPGSNAMSVGPIIVNTGVSVTVPSGQRWVIL